MIHYRITHDNQIIEFANQQNLNNYIESNGIEGINIEEFQRETVEATVIGVTVAEKIEFKPITPMYLRIVLEQMNLLSAIETELAKPENKIQQVAFEYALEFKRNHPFIEDLSVSLGLTSSQVDELFMTANQLKEMYD